MAAAADQDEELRVLQPGGQSSQQWQSVCEVGVSRFKQQKPAEFRRLVRSGIPQDCRWQVWKDAVRFSEHERELANRYRELKQTRSEDCRTIEDDVRRTFSKDTCFDDEKRQRTRNVLNVYSLHNAQVGYGQGMSWVAALIIMLAGAEEEAFIFFACLMDHLGLAAFHGKYGNPLVWRYKSACTHLVQAALPELYRHMHEELELALSDKVDKWFYTLFASHFPTSLAMACWDVVICEGLNALLVITVSSLLTVQDSLQSAEFSDTQLFFREPSQYMERRGLSPASLLRHMDDVTIPDYVLEYLVNPESLIDWWSWLKRRFLLPWTRRQRGISALFEIEVLLRQSPI